MATFTAYSNILPDPTHPIADSGNLSVSGSPGPGFSAVGFTSVTDTQVSRTISGRGISRDGGSHRWEFTLQYNPMFRDQFDVVDAFLTGRNPRRDPFYVVLPQYSKPKDPTFTNWLINTNQVVTVGTASAGSSVITLNFSSSVQGRLRPGDMFNIQDGSDFNHQKTYKVASIETTSDYQAGTPQPGINQLRVHIGPPLQRDVTAGAACVLLEPKFRVIARSDVQEHQLDTNNLYSFSLAVEEFQP